LYGGVSLAIYMNGTTNELHRAVRGRGVYFLIKHLLDADITVDVVSGASAGGINGIFLAFALANEREFATCADLWRRDGDLGTLLRRLDGDVVPSVLDSEHYRGLLENGFRVMWENEQHPDEPELPSPTPELDLFVTGTNFYGRYAQAVDSTGRVIETKQHRTVFLLKHRLRAGSKCQLDPRRDAQGRWDLSESERRAGAERPCIRRSRTRGFSRSPSWRRLPRASRGHSQRFMWTPQPKVQGRR
jgi:patatin-related protein